MKMNSSHIFEIEHKVYKVQNSKRLINNFYKGKYLSYNIIKNMIADPNS